MSCLIIFLLFVAACGEKPKPAQTQTRKDPRVAAIEERLAKTTPEGKQIIEKVLAMKPEVNEQLSGKPLGEIINEYATQKGTYNITPIGWEAVQKKPLPDEKEPRWKLVYHYQTYDKELLAAEWEYNPATGKLYPFEKNNAPTFWTAGPQPEAQAKTGSK
ncbi:MAG TPA: hypothetical protein VNO70_27470 [Blastocatellia bacterium]|nr:hypothetical protein [Blastocatellia bacterium]